MRAIDRISLIDKIGRDLQQRMSYADIAAFLSQFSVDVKQETSGTNSKWVYTKELLASSSNETISKIALELEIETPGGRATLSASSKFWKPDHFRIFVSHISAHKVECSALSKTLIQYGITAFVAHEDIEPTKPWQEEIESALFSMDCLAAVLQPGFESSRWCDQEVGIAVGREILIIPIRKGLDPYGFIGKYQGFQSNGKTVREVAHAIFEIVSTHPSSRVRYSECLTSRLSSSSDAIEVERILDLIHQIPNFPISSLEKLRENLSPSSPIFKNQVLLTKTQSILASYRVKPLIRAGNPQDIDDEIPF